MLFSYRASLSFGSQTHVVLRLPHTHVTEGSAFHLLVGCVSSLLSRGIIALLQLLGFALCTLSESFHLLSYIVPQIHALAKGKICRLICQLYATWRQTRHIVVTTCHSC